MATDYLTNTYHIYHPSLSCPIPPSPALLRLTLIDGVVIDPPLADRVFLPVLSLFPKPDCSTYSLCFIPSMPCAGFHQPRCRHPTMTADRSSTSSPTIPSTIVVRMREMAGVRGHFRVSLRMSTNPGRDWSGVPPSLSQLRPGDILYCIPHTCISPARIQTPHQRPSRY